MAPFPGSLLMWKGAQKASFRCIKKKKISFWASVKLSSGLAKTMRLDTCGEGQAKGAPGSPEAGEEGRVGRHRIRSSLLGPGTRQLGKQDVAGVSSSPEEELV